MKIKNMIGIFISVYKENLRILYLSLKWLQQKCNISHSEILQPLFNLFELEDTKLYINFIFLFDVFLTILSWFFLSHYFILVLHVFHFTVFIFHSFKGKSINCMHFVFYFLDFKMLYIYIHPNVIFLFII